MNLHQYPDQIFEIAQSLNSIDSEIARIRNEITRLENLAEACVAFDPSLKNDHQRKARRGQSLAAMDNYEPLQNQLIELSETKANLMAELERARNRFTAAKLEARAQIAQRLAASEFSEFVGV